MRTSMKEHSRAERLREHAALVDQARGVVAAMGLLVRGREARARVGDAPLEVGFASVDVEGRSLPAAVWVALRRGDVDAALDAMTTVSRTPFVVEEREEVGEGFRLQSVQETLPLPETDLLVAQLGRALDVPRDVLAVLGEWGPDDPRAAAEIDDLLSSRFGPVGAPETMVRTPVVEEAEPHAVAQSEPPSEPPAGNLALSVGELAQVLRLDDDQLRALTILVRNATVTLTPR